jgi:hypothetical protein
LLLVTAGTLLSLLLLALTFRAVAFDRVLAEVRAVEVRWLGLMVLIRGVNLGLMALRSQQLFAPLHRFGWFALFRSVLLAFAVNNVVPLRAGELMRVAYLARASGLPASSCVAVVALERLLDLLSFALLLLCLLPAMAVALPFGLALPVAAGALLLLGIAAIAVSRQPQRFVGLCTRLGRMFGRTVERLAERHASTFARGLAALGSGRAVLVTFVLALAVWLLSALSMRALLAALALELPWYAPVVVLAFVSVGFALPSTPGNLGTYHFFAASALTTLGVAPERAAAFALVGHAVLIVPFTVLSIPLLARDLWGRRSAV